MRFGSRCPEQHAIYLMEGHSVVGHSESITFEKVDKNVYFFPLYMPS